MNNVPTPSVSPGSKDLSMPQTQGTVPRTTATVHPYNIDGRQLSVSNNYFQIHEKELSPKVVQTGFLRRLIDGAVVITCDRQKSRKH